MQMTVSEIVAKYNRADNKKEQAQIIADLNGCDFETIREILRQQGADVTPLMPKKGRPKKKKEEEKAEEPAKKKWEEPELVPSDKSSELEEKLETKELKPLGKMEVPPDNMLYVCDDGSGAITGGEGVVNLGDDCDTAIKVYKHWRDLLETDPQEMSESERQRLERIKLIPDEVRGLVENEIGKLTAEIIGLEKRHDSLVDYLNGELPCKI